MAWGKLKFVGMAASMMVLVGCQFIAQLDPRYCAPSDAQVPLRIEEFRASQTNQTLDNSIPLLADRGVGLRVVIAADVESGIERGFSVAVDHVTAGGEPRLVATQEFDCIRSSNVMSHQFGAGALSEGDTLELRVMDESSVTVATATIAPRLIAGDYYTLVFVPLRVNDDEPTFDEELANIMALKAHTLFPTATDHVVRPVFDLGTIAVGGVERAREALRRLREAATEWAAADELPEFAVVVGIVPQDPSGTWGVGGGRHGITSVSMDMFLHEVGHALGAPHANGCGAAGALEGSTTVVYPLGYDHVSRSWHGGNDIMSYCHPKTWIGAPLYERIMATFERVRASGHTLQVFTLTEP